MGPGGEQSKGSVPLSKMDSAIARMGAMFFGPSPSGASAFFTE